MVLWDRALETNVDIRRKLEVAKVLVVVDHFSRFVFVQSVKTDHTLPGEIIWCTCHDLLFRHWHYEGIDQEFRFDVTSVIQD